jgi:hypothetical protein
VVAAAAAVSSSFVAHDPRRTTMPTIKTIQNSKFFIITSLHNKKMQYYYNTYVSGMVKTNTKITPRSHNLKQLKNAPGQFSVQHIPTIIRMQHFFFASCLFRFASLKSALTTLSGT